MPLAVAEFILNLPQDPPIAAYLLKNVLAKFAYIDESVSAASVSPDGALVSITVQGEPNEKDRRILSERVRSIQSFSDRATVERGRVAIDGNVYAPVAAMLAPTVCHHLYLALSDSDLPADGVVATASGHCFRFESWNMNSLERLWNFTMREIIFVGTEADVRTRLDDVRELLRSVLEEFQITYKLVTANDPFFIGTFRDQAAYQAAFELKYEIRAALPYKSDTVAVGSYNRHGNFFGKTLGIRLADGSPAYTGCIGIGFERFALAFVAQHGLDPSNWPPAVRAELAQQER